MPQRPDCSQPQSVHFGNVSIAVRCSPAGGAVMTAATASTGPSSWRETVVKSEHPQSPATRGHPVLDSAELQLAHFLKCTDSRLQLIHFRNAPNTYLWGGGVHGVPFMLALLGLYVVPFMLALLDLHVGAFMLALFGLRAAAFVFALLDPQAVDCGQRLSERHWP